MDRARAFLAVAAVATVLSTTAAFRAPAVDRTWNGASIGRPVRTDGRSVPPSPPSAPAGVRLRMSTTEDSAKTDPFAVENRNSDSDSVERQPSSRTEPSPKTPTTKKPPKPKPKIQESIVERTAVEREQTLGALEKLLERQQKDIDITQSLIESLRNNDRRDDDGVPVSSFAASVATGFDYGFQSRNEGAVCDNLSASGIPNVQSKNQYGPPANIVKLTTQQFWRNWDAIKGEYKDEEDVELTPRQQHYQQQLELLTLNSTAIWERETAHGPVQGPWLIKLPYIVLCWFLDVVFDGKYVPARFFYLETVARMPYFSYITMLHLYETLGFWRRSADVKRVHFAEEINEYRHLLIMESLGGDQQWWVRFLAQHSAIAYFLVLCTLFLFSPSLSYKFSDLLETHAVNTYGQMLDENEELLKQMPPSVAAVEYYTMGISDPFYAEFQTSAFAAGRDIRRPGTSMNSLYDVFQAIREDEGDHVATMKACLDPDVAVRSPSVERRVLVGLALVAVVGTAINGADMLSPTDVATMSDLASDTTTASSSAMSGLEGSTVMVDGLMAGAVAALQRYVSDDSAKAAADELASAAAGAVDNGEMAALLAAASRKFASSMLQFLSRIFRFL